MSRRRPTLAVALFAAALAFALGAAAARPPRALAQDAAPDSLPDLFRQLADSTDAAYGEESVAYDTTGLDSLTAFDFGDLPPPKPHRRRGGPSFSPILRFHRATGAVLGAGVTLGNVRSGEFHLEGSYGFGNKGGRYAARWRKPLFIGGRPLSERRAIDEPRIFERRTELDLVLGYARSTLTFMPEHSRAGKSLRAVVFGSDRQNVYESRGFEGALMFWHGDWRLSAGWEDGRDDAMARVSRFSLLGNRDSVPENFPAAADRFHGPTAGIAWWRSDWELGGRIDARTGGEDRWRVRTVLAKALRLGSGLKAYAQAEGGATATLAPVQRRMQVGGTRMLPTLHPGTSSGDHLLGGKLEFVSSADVLRGIGIGGPDWLVLQPYAVVGGAALWNDEGARNVVFARPPSTAWQGWAGAGFLFRPGIPDADTWVRIAYVFPIGPEAGLRRISFSIDRAFDLVGKL
jgi:hypothetical protein